MSWLIILSQSNSFVFLILWSIFPILYPVFYMPLQSIGEWQILHFTLYKPSKDPFSFICNKDENLLDAADKRHVNHCIISLSMNISFLSKAIATASICFCLELPALLLKLTPGEILYLKYYFVFKQVQDIFFLQIPHPVDSCPTIHDVSSLLD